MRPICSRRCATRAKLRDVCRRTIGRNARTKRVDPTQIEIKQNGIMRGKFFSYLRVSTDKQGERGYGIEAQRKAVEDYLNGGPLAVAGRVRRGRERKAE